MARILGVGIATLDIINSVEEFPEEDSEVRAIAQAQRRGGNATNTLVVLSQLGHQSTWAGTLADDPSSDIIRADLAKYGIDTHSVQLITGSKTPTSYVTLNQQNGSRTIVHYRDLAEYSFGAFQQIDLSTFDWLHFEGRNVEQTRLMLEYAREKVPSVPCSLEVEKPREGILALCSLANLLLYSRSYVTQQTVQTGISGSTVNTSSDPATFITAFLTERHQQNPTSDHVCTWGDTGAYGINQTGEITHTPAVVPGRVIDTLGAGDTFTAGFIHARLKNMDFADSLQKACKLAGQKCGLHGFDGLVP